MLNRLERELFRELQFLKILQKRMTEKERHYSKILEQEIRHLENVLEEAELYINE